MYQSQNHDFTLLHGDTFELLPQFSFKCAKVPHFYNYDLMKRLNEGKQMTDVWRLPAIGQWEKTCGKHPTQKPLALLSRIILASTQPHAWVLDPFAGSSTTGIAANLLQRRYLGIEQMAEFVELGLRRRMELEDEGVKRLYRSKIKDLKDLAVGVLLGDGGEPAYGDLPF